jgi:hypothetical protein
MLIEGFSSGWVGEAGLNNVTAEWLDELCYPVKKRDFVELAPNRAGVVYRCSMSYLGYAFG